MLRDDLSLATVTRTLAFIYHYSPNFLSAKCMAPTHLRRLAGWLEHPAPQLLTARAHRPLAAHLALLYGAELLDLHDGRWATAPTAEAWLGDDRDAQTDRLLAVLEDAVACREAVATLGLDDIFTIDYTAYLTQTLQRHRRRPPAAGHASWLPDDEQDGESEEEAWRLHLPDTLPPRYLFHLLQLGRWDPGEPLCCTPLSLATTVQRGYSPARIETYLVLVTDRPLGETRQLQLLDWCTRWDTYHLRPVWLLSTKQPEQLAPILENGRLRRRVFTQIGPRHALVSPEMERPLRRRLAREGYPLLAPAPSGPESSDLPDAAYAWLGLQVLAGIGRQIPLPVTLPHELMRQLEETLSPDQYAFVAGTAQAIVDGVGQAIRGRDGFFPARSRPTPRLVQQIKEALQVGETVHIAYQGLGERKPRWREVEPLRLAERGNLLYLHAYCYLAAGNRVFRLDRITACGEAGDGQ